MKKTVLIYHLAGEEEEALRKLAAQRKLRVVKVTPAGYEIRLSELAEREEDVPASPEGGEPFRERMMVFAGFEEGEFDLLLETLRDRKIGIGALKAVLTPTNARWTSRQLHAELQKEREAILQMRAARASRKPWQ